MHDYDIAIDYMDMTDDMRVWTRTSDARPGVAVIVGRYVTVGDDGADQRVARIVNVEADLIELEVLPGSLESHRDRLTSP